jgi:hypothetical protein
MGHGDTMPPSSDDEDEAARGITGGAAIFRRVVKSGPVDEPAAMPHQEDGAPNSAALERVRERIPKLRDRW